jgi:hypothetical protein
VAVTLPAADRAVAPGPRPSTAGEEVP